MNKMTNKQIAMLIGVVLVAVLTIVGIWASAFLDISISLSEETKATQETTTATSDPAPTEPLQTTTETTTQSEETTVPVVVPPVKDKRIALTFDDGPSSVYTAEILDVLKKYDAKATFFVVGYQLASKGAILSHMIEEGHQIGNHSATHPGSLTELSNEELYEEIKSVNDAIYELTRGYECTLLRPPGGNINGETLDRLYAGGFRMHTILWNADTRDWESNAKYKNGEITRDEAIEEAYTLSLSQVRDGSILLMHDIKEITPALLERLLETLSNDGYEFVTVDELFDFESMGEDAYFSKFYAEKTVTLLQ